MEHCINLMDSMGGCIDSNCPKCSKKDAPTLRLRQEEILEAELQWLKDHGCTFADVLCDEDGEYILSETDNGNPGEDGYSVSTQKIYLPNF